MSNEAAIPETKGVTSELLAAVDLGPEIEGWPDANCECACSHSSPEPCSGRSRPCRQTRDRLRPAGDDHGPSRWRCHGLRARGGLARRQEHQALAREQRYDRSGGDLGGPGYARVTGSSAGRPRCPVARTESALCSGHMHIEGKPRMRDRIRTAGCLLSTEQR